MLCSDACPFSTPTLAHCPACHINFDGLPGFDAHRRSGLCVDPGMLGMQPGLDSIWRIPVSR